MGSVTADVKTSALIDTIVLNKKALVEFHDDKARRDILAAAQKLVVQLENPHEQLEHIVWDDMTKHAAIRTAFELGLFKKLLHEPMSSEELAEGAGAEVELVARTVRYLAAHGILQEVDSDRYIGTPFSMATNEEAMGGAMVFGYSLLTPTMVNLPTFLSKSGYHVPQDMDKGPVQHGLNTTLPFFGWLQANPEVGSAFNRFMQAYTSSRPRWIDLYPCDEQILKGIGKEKRDTPLLVDIGGGLGHDLIAFHERFPNHGGKLVLEDQPHVVAQVKNEATIPGAVTAVTHDFFTPQPDIARGARAYYMRMIMHDWPDDKCREILSHIRDVMTPGYSKLLVNDMALKDVNASWQSGSLDFLMMGLLGAKERTEKQWRELFISAGLRLVKIWGTHGADETVLEVVRDDEPEARHEASHSNGQVHEDIKKEVKKGRKREIERVQEKEGTKAKRRSQRLSPRGDQEV